MSEGLIDERVVEMRFDNADFEQNVNQSIKTINKLKESLDFENAGESFENISAAAAKCDMKPLEESLDGITVKFNMLEMVAANVLGRIVNKALDAGAAMVKSLTIDQLTSGWGKYEQKTQAVQTIIAATGESIDYINGKLEKLIWFADETSYDFVDMVNNIGKFTSAGIDLDKSVDSMMGISNWAAQSGAGIQQASRAMYNLSQAIGMGYVGIQDWKSIELANMATREFKQTVIDTAVRLGTLKQAADGTITTLNGKLNVTAENMRSSLKEQWFTSDVLTDALSEYNEFANKVYEVQKSMGISANDAMEWLEEMGEDMDSLSAQAFKHAQEAMTFNQVIAATSDAVSSGWMRTFELIFGNYNQAKKLWTDLANDMWDVFAGSAENRNDLLKSVMSSEYQKMIEELPDGADFEYRLTQTIKEIGIKNGKTAEEMERLLTKYDTFEELLKTNTLQDFISNDTLEIAFSKVGDEYVKDAKAAADLSEKLKSQNNLLKNVVIGLANGYYGKEEEAARKKLESMGWTNFEYLEQLAEAYKYGLDISWDQETKDLIEALDTQKAVCDEFTKYLSKLNPFGSFFDSLRSLGGREKLISGFQNIIDSFKNFYLLIIEIKNGLEYLFHIDSFFSGLIDGFYNLTSIFRFSSNAFEAFQELVNEFFHGGIQKKIDEFLYGKQGKRIGQQWDALTDTMEPVFEHVPGLIENVSNAYHKYIERLPKETAASIEAVRVKIFGFFSSISEKYEKWKTDIFGTKIEVIDATDPKNVKTYFQYTGGLINEWKEKISNFFLNSLPGKAVSGLVTILQKISNYLFGYEDETQKIEGKLAPIFDKVTAFINMLKTIGKTIREFLFGKDFNQTGFGQVVHIPGLIEKVKTSVDSFVKSDTFQTIKRFFFGEKDAEGKVIKNNIFGKIGTAIDLFKSKIDILVQSAAFQAVKRFFFGEKDAEGKVIKNNIFGKIGTAITFLKSKIDILVQSEAFKTIKRFFFGEKDAEGNPIKNNIFGKIGTAITFLKSKIDILVQSDTFQAIKRFIFGDEQTNTPSIFEKIKQKIEDITGSIAKIFNFGGEENGLNIVLGIFNGIIEGIKSVKDWIKKHIFDPFVEGFKSVFGIHSPAEEMKPLGENILLGILQGILNVTKSIGTWIKEHVFRPIKNTISSAFKYFLDNTSIGNKIKKIIDWLIELKKSIDKIAESNTFKAIKRFFFGEKDAEGNPIKNNIFGKIGTAITFLKSKIDILVQSEAFKTIKRFFFGEKDAEGKVIKNNIFGKIGTAVNIFRKKIANFPEYIKNVKNNLEEFFLGKKKYTGKSWDNDNQKWIDHYIREGSLIDRLKEKFEQLKADHPWFASFCSFIETQLQNIKKIFDNADGSLIKAIEDLKKYLFGYKVEKKSGIFGLKTEFEHVNGVVDNLIESIHNLFSGENKNKDKSLVDRVLDLLGINQSSLLGKLRNALFSLVGINVMLSSFKIGKGKFTFLEYKNGLDTIIEAIKEIVDSFKELAISIAILTGTFIVLTAYLHFLDLKNTELIRAGVILVGIGAALLVIAKFASKIGDNLSVWHVLTLRVIADAITQLAIVAAALTFFIHKTGTGDDFTKVVALLALLITAIGVAGALMMKDGKDIKTAAGSFFGFAAILHEFTNFLFTAMLAIGVIYILLKKKLIDIETLKSSANIFLQILLAAVAFMAGIALVQAIVNKTASKINFSTFLSMIGIFESAKGLIVLITGVIAGIYFLLERNKSRDSNGNAVYDTSTLDRAFGGMVAVLIVVAVFLAALAAIMNKFAKTDNIHISKFLFLITLFHFIRGFINAVITAAGVTALVGWENMAVVMAGISILLLATAGMISILDGIKHVDLTTFEALLVMFGAIAGFAAVVTGFDKIGFGVSDIKRYAKLVGAIALLAPVLLEFAWVFKQINSLGNLSWNTLIAIAGMDLAIISFGAVVLTLNLFAKKIKDFNGILKLLGSIVLLGPLLIEFAGILWVLEKTNISTKAFSNAVILLIGIGLLARAVQGLISITNKTGIHTYDALLPIFVAISEVVASMIVLALAVSLLGAIANIPTFNRGLLTAIEMLIGIGLLAMAVWGLSAVANKANIHSYDAILPMIVAIGQVAASMIVLSGVIALLGLIGGVITPLLIPAVIAIAAVTAGVILIGAAFIAMEKALAWLSEKAGNDSITDSINSVMQMMITVAHGIGEMIGAFVGGIGEGITDSLPAIGENLSEFMTSLQPFLTMVQQLDQSHVDGAGYLTKIMASIVADEILGAISALIENFGPDGGMLQVAQNMGAFMTALDPFLTKIMTLNEEHVTGAGYLTKIMGEIVTEEALGWIAALIDKFNTGNPVLMAINLGAFITSLQPFLNGILLLTDAHITGAARLTLILTSILVDNALTWLSTLIDNFTGGSAIAMATNLSGFLTALNPFLNDILNITEAHVKGAEFLTSVMKEIVKQEALDALDNIIKYFVGETNYQTYVDNLLIISGGIIEMDKKLQKVDKTKVSDDIEIIKSVLNLVTDSNYKSGGLAGIFDSIINGSTNFKGLFTKLNDEIADGFVTFASKVSGVNVESAKKASEILPSIMDMLTNKNYRTGGISGFFNDLLTGDANYIGMFSALNEKILPGLRDFAQGVNALDEEGKQIDYSNIDSAAEAIKSVIDIMTMDTSNLINDDKKGWWIFKENSSDADKISDSFLAIQNAIVPAISSLQKALIENEVDQNYIYETIGVYSDLINTLMDFKNVGLSVEDVAKVGEYIITGLVTALDEGVELVKAAASRVAAGVTEGLTLTLEIHSPSKVAEEIGKFITQGLTNGLLAGEPLTWRMAREFGEGTVEALMDGAKKYKAYGLTKHAINMVTSDLLDENIFNMPDFSSKNRFGNADVDFEAMANWLHEKFDEEFGPEYINSFVGSYKQTMAEINQVINDEDYAKIITGIGAGDFGLSEDTIIKKLTEELGSLDAAKLAWQDYNDVKEGTLKINQDLLKQQKQDPPMTLEQYMKMLRKEQEDYNRVLSGEFDTLAAQNGTTRFEEMTKAGIDAWHMQQRLDRDFSENMHPMTQEEIEAYVYAKAQAQALTAAVEENADATQNVVTVTTENAQASADAASELKNQTDATNELADANNNLTSSASEIPHNYVFDAEMLDLMNREQAEVVGLAKVTDTLTDSVSAAAASMDEKNDTLTDQTAKTEEAAQAAQDAADATKDMAEAIKDAAAARQIDYKAADAAITAIQNGTAATEEQLAALKALQEETIKYGTYGNGNQNRISGWVSNGVLTENAEYIFGMYDLASVNFDKVNDKLKETADGINKISDAAINAESSTGTLIDGLYDRLPDSFKSLADVFTSGYDDKGNGIKVKVSDIVKFIPDGTVKDIASFVGLDKSDMSIDIPVGFKIPDGASVKDYISSYLVGMFSEEDAAGTASISIDKIIGFVDDFVSKKDLSEYFEDGKKAVKKFSEATDTAKQKTDELNNSLSNTGKDFPQIDYAQKYIQQVDEAVASHGYKRLKEGVRLNQKEAAELQKIWYNAVQGSYGSDFVEHLKENFGIDWDELNRVITPSGHFNPEKVNPYLEYADSLLGNEDYKTENLFQDILDGKFGSDKDRKEALETLGYDYDKIQDKLNKYRRGEMTWEELIDLGDSYGKVTDEEKKYAKEHEELLKTLNTTPEGAFRSIADFLDGVTSVLKDPKTSKNFTDFINEIVGSLETIRLPNASQFEIVGNFLNAVRNTARESSGIAKDFKDFVDGIKGSVEELGTITIDNPDGLNQVVDFLNSIKIKNKETLDTVASFIGNIVEFATGANAGGDYSTKLVEAIGRIEYAINHLDVDPSNTEPVTEFLKKLTDAAGILSESDSNSVQQFINNLYKALEDSSDQAASAASTIATFIINTLSEKGKEFSKMGTHFVMMLAAGMIAARKYAVQAAETISGSLLNIVKDQATDKASQTGKDFISGLITGLTSEESKLKIKDAMATLFGEERIPFPKLPEKDDGKPKSKKEEYFEENIDNPEVAGTQVAGAGTTEGTQYGQNFVSGMAAAIQNGSDSISGAISSMVSGLADASISFDAIIQSITTGFATLATTLTGIAEAKGEGTLAEATSKINSLLGGMVPDGEAMAANMVDGIIAGVIAGAPKVKAVMAWLAAGGQGSFNYENDANSPAKKYIEFAGYIIDGLVIGIQNGEKKYSDAVSDTAKGALDQFSSAIAAASDVASSELNLDPVITPVIDMSEVTRAASDIDAALSTNRAIDISTAERSKYTADSNNPQNQPGSQTFIQNNYSPNPLSRLEIYRQTRNQFAMLKGAYVQST